MKEKIFLFVPLNPPNFPFSSIWKTLHSFSSQFLLVDRESIGSGPCVLVEVSTPQRWMWLFRKQLVDVVSCKLKKRISNRKTTCPREHFHNANSEKQTFKVMSGINVLFIISSIFIKTIWWVIYSNNNKTLLNPGVFRSLQTDNRIEFQQCLPGF